MRSHNALDPRRRRRLRPWSHRLAAACALAAALALTGVSIADRTDPNLQPFADPSGATQTVSMNGYIDTSNPFFQPLGTNGRACVTCHQPSDGWTITPAHVQERFDASNGLDPIFRPNDGADSPLADVSTLAARRSAYSMLLTKGLIRVGIGVPAGAQFTLTDVQDPYHYASAQELSLFRRPLPATNLPFLSAVMWDGRETVAPISGSASGQALQIDLAHQAQDAIMGHAQAATAPTPQQLRQIVAFEKGLFSAQVWDNGAGDLTTYSSGGPRHLSRQPFYIGINDPLGHNPTGAAFNPAAFTLAEGWSQTGDGGAAGRVAGAPQGALQQ